MVTEQVEHSRRRIPNKDMSTDSRKLFEELALPILDDLFRFACRLESDAHRAEDLVQDALLRGFRKFRQLRDAASFRAWMIKILYRRFLNQRDRQRYELSATEEELDALRPAYRRDRHFDPEERFLIRSLSLEVRNALSLLRRIRSWLLLWSICKDSAMRKRRLSSRCRRVRWPHEFPAVVLLCDAHSSIPLAI